MQHKNNAEVRDINIEYKIWENTATITVPLSVFIREFPLAARLIRLLGKLYASQNYAELSHEYEKNTP